MMIPTKMRIPTKIMIPTRRMLTSLEKAYIFFRDRDSWFGKKEWDTERKINHSARKLRKKIPFYQDCAMVDEICKKFGLYKDLSNYIKDKVADNYDFFDIEDECSCDGDCDGYKDCGDYDLDESLMCSCCHEQENLYYRLKDPGRKERRDIETKRITLKRKEEMEIL